MTSLEQAIGTREATDVVAFSRQVNQEIPQKDGGLKLTLDLPYTIDSREIAEKWSHRAFKALGIEGAQLGETNLDDRTIDVVLDAGQAQTYHLLMREVEKADQLIAPSSITR